MILERLKKRIEELAANTGGILGLALKTIDGGETLFIEERHVFPSASVIKVAILIELFRQAESGGLSLDEEIELRASEKVGGAGILFELHDGISLMLRDLACLMIVISDNTASNMILDRVGMERVNSFMGSIGMNESVIGRKFMIDPASLHQKNFTTPYDTLLLLEKLYRGELLNEENTAAAMEILCRQQYFEKIPLLLPRNLKIAHKTGEIDGVRHDAGIVLLPENPYILVVLTERVKDEIETDRIINQISREIYGFLAA